MIARKLRDRPTPDLVILGLTGVVCMTVLATVVALVVSKLEHPDADVADLAKQVSGFISTLVAVIVGYVGGRGVNDPPPPTKGPEQ